MNIRLAENAGFCFGVDKAVKTIKELIDKTDKKIYTLGPVIHNRQLNDELREKGVEIIAGLDQATQVGHVVVRAHGVTPEEYDLIKQGGQELVDLTCPYVRKVQLLVRDMHREGCNIIIIGDKNHPEVMGIKGWSGNTAYVVNEKEDADKIPDKETKVCLVAQTTITHEKWLEIVEYIDKLFKKVLKFDTICNATAKRQEEGSKLAAEVDMMIVIGSQDSSNTQKLYEICSRNCPNTYKVETVKDLPLIDTSKIKNIGITAGASTPGWVIKEVVDRMEELERENEQSINIQEEKQEAAGTEQDSEREVQSAEQDSAVQEKDESPASEILETAEAQAEAEDTAAKIASKPEAEEAADSQEETQDTDSDISFAEAIKGKVMGLQYGSIVSGTIVRFDNSEVIVNINYKFEGVIPVSEYSSDPNFDPYKELKVGDEIEVMIVNINQKEGIVELSRKEIVQKNNLDFFRQAKKDGTPIETEISEIVNGGVIARVNGEKIFIPASQVSDHYIKDLSSLVKTKLTIRIIEFDRKKKKIVGSARVLIEEEKKRKEQEIWDRIQVGEEYRGTVSGLTDFGAFVDIGGVDGLIYLTELSWKKIKHPSEVLQKGDEVTVRVLEADREKKRISLGYRRNEDNPWLNITERYNAGDIIKGKVVGILPFGAFVEIEKGLDGLVHVSQISNKRINRVENVLQLGMEVEAKIVEINTENQRISLSIKEVNPIDPPESDQEEGKKKERRFGKRSDKKTAAKPEAEAQNNSAEAQVNETQEASAVNNDAEEIKVSGEAAEATKPAAAVQTAEESKNPASVKNPPVRKEFTERKNSANDKKSGEPRKNRQPHEKELTSHTEELSNKIGDMLSGLNLLANLKLNETDAEDKADK